MTTSFDRCAPPNFDLDINLDGLDMMSRPQRLTTLPSPSASYSNRTGSSSINYVDSQPRKLLVSSKSNGASKTNLQSSDYDARSSSPNRSPRYSQLESIFIDLVKANAANDKRLVSTKIKHRDASLELLNKLQKYAFRFLLDEHTEASFGEQRAREDVAAVGPQGPFCYSSDNTNNSIGKDGITNTTPFPPEITHDHTFASDQQISGSSTSDRLGAQRLLTSKTTPMELTLDQNMNPRKPRRPRQKSEADRARIGFVRRRGACEEHRRSKKA